MLPGALSAQDADAEDVMSPVAGSSDSTTITPLINLRRGQCLRARDGLRGARLEIHFHFSEDEGFA